MMRAILLALSCAISSLCAQQAEPQSPTMAEGGDAKAGAAEPGAQAIPKLESVPPLANELTLPEGGVSAEQAVPEKVAASVPFSVSDLFAKYKKSIYQIRAINEATGQKTSIGSGFIVGDGSMLATNYHVVSDAVQKENRILSYVDSEDNEGTLELLGVDVVHDLAVLKADKHLGEPFSFAPIPPQGAPLYALGNPHDLGFVIVDGTNNGLLRKSAREQVLFSGSLNSGMSGGPTLNTQGKVVGVNVSTLRRSGDISFIIPSDYLQELLDTVSDGEKDLNTLIAQQLFDDNGKYYGGPLAQKWPSTTIGHFRVPLAMRDDVRCWDASPDPDVDDLLGIEAVACYSDRATFISDDITLGQMAYSYSYFYPREDMLSLRFYRTYSHFYNTSMQLRPQRDYDDVACESNFVKIAGRPFKTTFCIQPSKKFIIDDEPIEDVRLIAAEIGEAEQGFIIEIGLNGIQDGLGRKILAHMLEQIEWVD
ncbi:serine protease [Cardiobacteriaceae bacterium TAE3-ERU3]|nr:serine protease [Cardiobacteriaceae bacterium TAE3-ERU3]